MNTAFPNLISISECKNHLKVIIKSKYGLEECLIDFEDMEYLRHYKLTRNKNYVSVGRHLIHRLILDVSDPKTLIDHVNGNFLDNRRSNLRIASKSQNAMNSTKQKRKTSSIYKGVTWCKRTEKWKAYIYLNGKRKNLGSYISENEAAEKYNAAAESIFGEFCKLNIIRYR
jgi:hypothetical protein